MITALFRTRLLAMVVLGMLVASGPAFAQTDYDTDNDNYIDVSTHAQLNAIRWDLNGDGAVAATDTVAYNDAFPTPPRPWVAPPPAPATNSPPTLT